MTGCIVPKMLFKRFAQICLISLTIFFTVLYTGICFEQEHRLGDIVRHEEYRLQLASERVARDLRGVDMELRFLANLPQLRRYLDHGDPQQKKELEETFLILSRETGRYDQIRYIDANGLEVIRINFNQGHPTIEPEERLQDKSGRYYFSNTVSLNSGEVYVSPLDLNIEHGEIELPYKPMIRYGIPVFDSNGKNQGILVLNYFGEELLNDFRMVMRGGRDHISMLLNSDGYWLSSDRRQDEWGFMLSRNGSSFALTYPDEWKSIATAESGSITTADGLFIFTTVHPLMNKATDSRQPAEGKEPYAWKAVSYVSQAVLAGEAFYNQTNNRILLSISGVLLIVASFLVALLFCRREQARAALRDSVLRIRTILDNVSDGIITIDEHGIVETYNTAAEKLFGFKAEEIIGRNVSQLMPEPYHSEHNGYIARYGETGEAHVIGRVREAMGLHQSGYTFPVELGISEMKLDGQRYFTGVVRDISIRKEAEALLLKAKESAESVSRAKDSFLATMSHEIRTPLTGLLGMLEVLSLSRLDNEQNQILESAWSSGQSLLRIVSDILDWSKIEEGKLELSILATSIPQLVREVESTYSRAASAKGLLLIQQVDPRLSEAHFVDPLRLSQVLNNFVSNAIKFTRRGKVELKAELLERKGESERIRFTVSDTGIGIAVEAQSRLFRRYQQEGADTARMYGGTGLGLSICQRLARLMGGEITLESTLGQGATFGFTLNLPVAGVPAENIRVQPSFEIDRDFPALFQHDDQAPRALVVDDHAMNRKLLQRQLELLGCLVDTAEDGKRALSMWRQGEYALVITDCHMPVMDGYELSRHIRDAEEREGLPRTLLVAWTANALDEEKERCRSAGMDELMVKPTTIGQLREMLVKAFDIHDEAKRPSAATSHVGDAHIGTSATPINFSELEKVVPDSAEHPYVLDEFRSHLRHERLRIATSIEEGDRSLARLLVHSMKGSSLMIGAIQLAEVCKALEQALDDDTPEGIREQLMEFGEKVDELEDYLASIEGIGGSDV